ncbi:MAG: TRAP transporter large permease [Alcaligenaceae bacterium]|nr:TRAP transporter large permease [Alcaligenaceae bacterium]
MLESAAVVFLLLLLIGAGMPIFLALGLSGLLGLFMEGGITTISFAPSSFFGQLNSFELIALLLFILMGDLLSTTPVGENLFNVAVRWLSWLRGGLAIATVGTSTLFGAVSGVSIAGVAAVGSIAVPQMLDRGYSKSLASGSVVASGALAMLIPPSVPFIIYGAISGVSISALFIGGIVPGVVLAMALSLYIYIRATARPEEAPRSDLSFSWAERFRSLLSIWHAALLVLAILGSIYAGIATPSEASAIGAACAFLIALYYRRITFQSLLRTLKSTSSVCGSILLIIGCSKIFGDYLNLIEVPQKLTSALTATNLPSWSILLIVMLLLILLGMLIDAVSLIVVTTPILLPLIESLGYSPLWFGIVLVLNLEMAVVTPPVGLNLYVLRGVCPNLKIEEIIKGALPFVAVQFLVLMLFVLVPEMGLWLPSLM